MRKLAVLIFPIIVLASAGCGSSGGDGLSSSEEAKLKTALSNGAGRGATQHRMGAGEAKAQKMQAQGGATPPATTG